MTLKLREEVAFVQFLRAPFAKLGRVGDGKGPRKEDLDVAAVITKLVELAKKMREAHNRSESLGLSEDEEAFYEVLEVNDSAVAVMGDNALCAIARELVDSVRRNVTIHWTVKDNVPAKLRKMVKKILKKRGYPPDKQVQATETVLNQAQLLCADWAP